MRLKADHAISGEKRVQDVPLPHSLIFISPVPPAAGDAMFVREHVHAGICDRIDVMVASPIFPKVLLLAAGNTVEIPVVVEERQAAVNYLLTPRNEGTDVRGIEKTVPIDMKQDFLVTRHPPKCPRSAAETRST